MRDMGRQQYRDLRHRYRHAQREDSRATTMNASEWRRGIRQDTAGPIRSSVPADIGATLDHRDSTTPMTRSPQLSEALARLSGRRYREQSRQKKAALIAAVMAESRRIDRSRE